MAAISGSISGVSGVLGLLSFRCGEGRVGGFRGVRQSVRPRPLHGCSEKAERKQKYVVAKSRQVLYSSVFSPIRSVILRGGKLFSQNPEG